MTRKYPFMKYLNLALISLLIFILTACGTEDKETRFDEYTTYWQAQEYGEMYNMLSQSAKDYISKDDFVGRYTTIYEAIDAEELEISINTNEEETNEEMLNFHLKMDTFLGELSFDNYSMQLVREEQAEEENWFVEWDESLIFPDMKANDEVRIKSTAAERGEIYDANGEPLAINGTRSSIGIYPAQFDELNISRMAAILDIDPEDIQEKLDQNTNPEYFVPIVKVAHEEEELIAELLAIKGVLSQKVNSRVYPGGEAFGALIGYINPITKEELDASEAGVYSATSILGKAGIESVYEEELRAIDGQEIYISKITNGEEVEQVSLIQTAPKNGEDIQLTIDSALQKKIYEEASGEVGTASAVNPATGEVLALVSYPSYDSNFYTTYTPNAQREVWENMEANAFENRFNKAYSPGSAFKLVTAAIGMEEGIIEPNKKLRIEGKGWQKDPSWGNYKVNRVSQKLSQVDLEDAFIYSDNIYFAQNALKIGSRAFIEQAKDFGIGEEFPFIYPFANSQLANNDSIDNEILLADTGYGQGEVLMSALHLSLIYGALVNDGQMMHPTLERIDSEIWKEDVFTEENKEILLDNLIATIEHPDGTGRLARIEGLKLAGKTSTVELKGSQEERGQENGWFVALNVDNPEIVISMMIEDIGDRGGSAYTVQKVRNILVDYFDIE